MQSVRSYSACLLGAAVQELFPAVIPISWRANSFLFSYDFAAPHVMGPELLQLIEEKMHRLKNLRFETKTMMRENAISFLEHKNRSLQATILREYPQNMIDIVSADTLFDVAFEPVVEHETVYVSLLSGVCQRCEYSSIGNIILWRISGVAFTDKKELKNYCKDVAKAKKSDPVTLAEEQKLVSFFEHKPLWLTSGIIVHDALQTLWRAACHDLDIHVVKSPRLERIRKTQDPFEESIQHPVLESVEESHGHLLSKLARVGELVDRSIALPEWEQEGLFLTSGFVSDSIHILSDTHLLEQEIVRCIKRMHLLMKEVGVDVEVDLYLPKQKMYHEAFRQAAGVEATSIRLRQGGPRIEFIAKDLRRRRWQLGFVELDMLLTQAMKRPVLAVSLFYSFERIVALLLEKNKGLLPPILVSMTSSPN